MTSEIVPVPPTASDVAYVLHCVRTYFGRGEAEFTSGDVTPQGIYEAARLNKVGNFLTCLPSAESQDFHAPLRVLIDNYRRRTIALNSSTLAATLEASSALERRGLRHVVVKGPLRQQQIYGGYFTKPSGDVDLLVMAPDFAVAGLTLAELGYQVEERAKSIWWRFFLGEQHFVRRGSSFTTIDLHHRLGQPGTPSPRTTTSFLDSARAASVGGRSLPILDPKLACLLTGVSVAKALFNREPCLGTLCDFWCAMDKMPETERDDLRRLARIQGLDRTLLFALRAANIAIARIDTPFSAQAGEVMSSIGDRQLLQLVSQPWSPDIIWPKRRAVLWELCDGGPLGFGRESLWATSAELSRRLFDIPAER